MRILFFMRSNIYVRNFESTLRLLAERGHQVHIVADTHEHLDPTDLVGRLCREYPGITHGSPPRPASPEWVELGVELRKGLDYLRYFGAEYKDAPKLRQRAGMKAPIFSSAPAWQKLVGWRAGRSVLAQSLRIANRALPADCAITAFARDRRPDLVVVTPLVEPGSPQSEYLRGARSLGIPTALCVYSWDNLTNKGLIHDPLQLVTVWNEPMKREAVALHGVPADRVTVTGAVAYDHWFSWAPRRDRIPFCERVGLDAARPYLLYLCSSRFIAPDELPFVKHWIQEIRRRSDVLREAGVLIRPHPQNAGQWRDADLAGLDKVAIWPRAGANPADEESRTDYYDSIFHSAAVVGVNTSAQIESAIVGRPVHAAYAPEFRDTQDGTLHFHHLRDAQDGVLQVASDLDEQVRQLEQSVQDPARHRATCRRFVEAFVRPQGLDQPSAPRLVAILEATAATRVRPARTPAWVGLVRPRLARAAAAVHHDVEALDRQVRERKEKARRNKAAKAASVDGASPSAESAFAQYERLRDEMRRLRAIDLPDAALTPREQQQRGALQALWDAPPGTVSRLREFGEVISGVRARDYDPGNTALKERLERHVRLLLERGDRSLWVDEPAALGGFGFNGRVTRYNADTLEHFRIVSLLNDAAVLDDFRGGASRQTVWEIGGGWGGFAFQFKTLCPGVTYLITGPSEQLLLSAAYLTSLLPSARFRVFNPEDPAGFWTDWHAIDFAFAPDAVAGDLRPASLSLTVDCGALAAMREERAIEHVHRAHALGCRYVVSASPVPSVLERFYWPHPVSAPGYLAKRLVLSGGEVAERPPYFLGWRRLLA